MDLTSNIFTLLKNFSTKTRSAVIDFSEFSDYVRSYAQHHVSENSELQAYLGSTDVALEDALKALSSAHKIILTTKSQGSQSIFVISSFIDLYSERYKDIDANISIPFPNMNDIPKGVPQNIVTKTLLDDLMYKIIEKTDNPERALYALEITKGCPALLYPSTVTARTLIKLALKKVQDLLRKEESHDYFLKKLTISNPGKELSIKKFFNLFVARPEDALEALKYNGDNFYSWSQLCYFLKQDYNKVKDLTTEDINILQSVAIIEFATSYYKTKTAEKAKKEAAFKDLDGKLQGPPYYFSKKDIENMKDKNGRLLLDQYSQEDLNEHIKVMHTETQGSALPDLLMFKMETGESYFILKEKVMPLVIRLCNDARNVIRESLSREWFQSLVKFDALPEMRDQLAFENCLERELSYADPVLYSILHATFLPVVAMEEGANGSVTLYRNGSLVSYSELLLISRQDIYDNARAKLPFYYSIPGLAFIINFFSKLAKKAKNKKNSKKEKNKTATEKTVETSKEKANKKMQDLNDNDKQKRLSKAKAIRSGAAAIESKIVPENTTIDRELDAYHGEWNDRLDPKARENLREDINTLIRDYIRKTVRTFKTEDVTYERIQSLAKSLEEAPALINVKNHKALLKYIELYMVKLLKNLPST